MLHVIAAIIIGGVVAASAYEKKQKAKGEPKLGADGKPVKVKTEAEIFADGKTAGRTEAEAEFKRQAAHDDRVAKQARSAARAEVFESLAGARRPTSRVETDDN